MTRMMRIECGSQVKTGDPVSVNGLDGCVDDVDPDGRVHVRMPNGITVSGYPAGTEDKSWPPSGIETKGDALTA